jgi:hypothetical protein
MAQGSMQPLPGTIDAPSSEVVVDGFPRWELLRQQAPSTTTSDDVEDSVKDLAQGVYPGPSGGFLEWVGKVLCRTTQHWRGRLGKVFSCVLQ